MAKPEWGAKRACPSCGARFYDLLRDPVECPSCGASFALEALSERRTGAGSRSRPKAEKPVAVAAVAAAAPADDAAVLDDDAEEEDEEIASDDVLLDDEDDDGDLGEIAVAKDGDEEET